MSRTPRALPCLTASFLASTVLSMSAASALSAQTPSPPPPVFEVGQAFPMAAFPALEDGQPRSIADFRGQKVVLHVFASW